MRKLTFFLISLQIHFFVSFAQEKPDKGKFIPLPNHQINMMKPSSVAIRPSDNIIFSESFEGSINWTNQGGTWQVGTPASGPGSAYNGTKCLTTNSSGQYSNEANAYFISPPISLPSIAFTKSLKLSFVTWYQLESGYDYGYVLITTNNGVNWTQIGSAITGTSGNSWILWEQDITSYAGKTVKIAFHFTSDYSGSGDGWFIDNVIKTQEERKNLNINLSRIDIGSFPTIKLYAIVTDSSGQSIDGLTKNNFTLTEQASNESSPTTENIDITSIQGTGGISVALVIDGSGSMGGQPIIDAKNAASNFVNLFSNLDRGAIISFSSYATINQDFTSDKNLLLNAIQYSYSGGSTALYDAIYTGLDRTKLESAGAKAIVALTDGGENASSNHKLSKEIIEYANRLGIPIWTIGLGSADQDTLKLIANKTGGQYFYTPNSDQLAQIYQHISAIVRNQYLIAYNSHNTALNGLTRTVKVTVNYLNEQDDDSLIYKAINSPSIQRNPATIALSDQSQIQGSSIPIAAWITGPIGITQASLFYKNASDTGGIYVQKQMNLQSGSDSLYIGWIPGSDINPPGISYYITASDSFTTVSDPLSNPQIFPHQFAVLPNKKPNIIHTPVTAGTPGQPITIEAVVTDSTQYVRAVEIYYRKTGNVLYSPIKMIRVYGTDQNGTWKGHIPESEVTDAGIDYFIRALDSYWIANYSGTDLNPYHISTDPDYVLLNTYMPKLFFTDGMHEGRYHQEKIFPINIEWFLNNSKLYDLGNNLQNEHPTASNLCLGYWGLYLRLNEPYHSDIKKIPYNQTPYIYGRVTTESQWSEQIGIQLGVPAKVLQYWIFYPYNKFYINGFNIIQGDHEGDWELIEIKLNPNDNSPREVSYSQHIFYEIQPWVNVEKISYTHPKVYVANGTHANYFTYGEHSVFVDNMPELMVNWFLFNIINNIISPDMSLEIQKVLLEQNTKIILSDAERWLVGWLVGKGVQSILYFQEVWNRGLQTFREFIRQIYTFSPALSGFDIALGNTESFGIGREIQISKIKENTRWVNYEGYWGEYKTDLIGGLAQPPSGLSNRKAWKYPFKKLNIGVPFLVGSFAYVDPFDALLIEINSPIKISIIDSLGNILGFKENKIISEINNSYYLVNHSNGEISRFGILNPSLTKYNLNVVGEKNGNYQIELKYGILGKELKQYIFADSIAEGQTISIPFELKEVSNEVDLIITPVTKPPLNNKNIYSFPNPFNPEFQKANLRYALFKDASVTVKIFDVANNAIKTIVDNESQIANLQYSIQWDGRNAKGEIVSNGVYYYVISTSTGERAVGKVAVLR